MSSVIVTLILFERRLFKKNVKLDVTQKELEVLQVLIENAGQVVSKEELLEQIWGDSFVEESNLAVQVSKLRKRLGATRKNPILLPNRVSAISLFRK